MMNKINYLLQINSMHFATVSDKVIDINQFPSRPPGLNNSDSR